MKILHEDLKYGEVKVAVGCAEDLWCLSEIVEPSDVVSGVTLRKVLATEKESERKRVFLSVRVEKTEFTESSFRATGKIIDGPEDVPRGSYHTFSVEVGDVVNVKKGKWFDYQLERLKEACVLRAKILVCCFDREDAVFALVKHSGFEILSKIRGDVAKKDLGDSVKLSFYPAIIRQLCEYDSRYGLDHIIVASPAFWKDEFVKFLNEPELKRKITMSSCSSVDSAGVDEVLRREEVHSALKQDRVARESSFVERLMSAIARDGAVAYGLDGVENAALSGAVDTLLVSDGLIKKSRDADDFGRLENVMRQVDGHRGVVLLVSSQNSAGKRLDGLGGIGALLRYKLAYK